MPIELTQRQEEILQYIQRVLESEGSSPSVQEIQSEFGFRSPNAAQQHLKALLNKGVIERRGRRRRARSLRLVSGVEYRRRETVGEWIEQPREAISPVIEQEKGYEIETGFDVFFNARHVVGEEYESELHAHSWRLRVVVLLNAQDEDSSEHIRGLGAILQETVGELEGTVLNQLDLFHNEEPTLDRLAALLNVRVTSRLAPLNLKVLSTTLWDQPIRYVTIMGRGGHVN